MNKLIQKIYDNPVMVGNLCLLVALVGGPMIVLTFLMLAVKDF